MDMVVVVDTSDDVVVLGCVLIIVSLDFCSCLWHVCEAREDIFLCFDVLVLSMSTSIRVCFGNIFYHNVITTYIIIVLKYQ